VLARASEEAPSFFRRLVGSPSLKPGEIVLVPVVRLDAVREYGELAGRRVLNEGFTDAWIETALQSVRFRLDEAGAVLRSEAVIGAPRSAGFGSRLRSFVFDGPFMILM